MHYSTPQPQRLRRCIVVWADPCHSQMTLSRHKVNMLHGIRFEADLKEQRSTINVGSYCGLSPATSYTESSGRYHRWLSYGPEILEM